MPVQKDLKRLVRTRMQKTGESYTAARTRVLDKKTPVPADCARLAGMSDSAVRGKTGLNWRQWTRELDAAGAASMPHREIAKHVHEHYDVSGWWAQTVTVGYERIRGKRAVGQRCDGKYQASKSKTFGVPSARLYRAFGEKRTRDRWLPDVELKIRTSQRNRSMRIDWPDGTLVSLWFTAKAPQKSSVAIEHGGLADKSDVEARKAYWAERLAALGGVLAT